MIVNQDNIEEALNILKDSPEEIWSIDLETYNPYQDTWFMELSAKKRPLNRIDSKIVSLQLATPSGIEMYFDFNHRQEGEDLRLDYAYLGIILDYCKLKRLIAHNAGFEYGMILRHGYDCQQDYYDTMIMGVLYNENMPQGLKPTIKHRFGYVMHSYSDTVGSGTMRDITAVEGYEYGMDDAIWTLKLYDWLVQRINLWYYETFEMDLIKIISKQYAQGQAVDLQELDRIQAEDIQTKNQLLATWPKFKELNLNSPKQIRDWLFNELKLQPFKVSKTTGQPSTDKESLFELEQAYGKELPIIKAFSEIKKVETRLKLYYRPYPNLIYPDGLFHSEIRQSNVVTGRFSMNSPNLQQIAKRGEGVKVRGVFVPFKDRGHDCIVSIDWSQIELRMAAHMSKDPKLIDAYNTGKDLHTVSGTNISGDDYDIMMDKLHLGDKKAKKARQAGKCLNFAALYLAQPKRLSAFDLLDCSVAEAEDFLQAHKKGYSAYFYDYVNKVNAILAANASISTLFGRVRHLPNINSPMKVLKSEAQGQGLNFTIQGSAGELMKIGLIEVDKQGLLFAEDHTFIIPVHDEYVFSANSKTVHEWLPKVVEIMQWQPKGFAVPIVAEASIGPNFAIQKELEGNLSKEHILEVLNDI